MAVGKRALVGSVALGPHNRAQQIWAGCDRFPLLRRGVWGQGAALGGSWEEFSLFEFGVCLNEGQGTRHWKHREETEAPKCCVQLSCLVLSRGGSERAEMSWVWPLAVVSLSSAQRNLLSRL